MSINTYTEGIKKMFTKIGLQGVESSEGFIVGSVGRYELLYQEGEHKLIINIEGGWDKDNKFFISIYTSTITHWQPPYENEPITEEKKQQIIQRICAALDFLEIRYVLE